MVIAASLCVLVTAQFGLPPRYVPLPGYRPAFFPKALAGAECDGVLLDATGIRGWRPIRSRWILKRPYATVALPLTQETAPDPSVARNDDDPFAERRIGTYRRLPDRIVEVFLRSGREEVFRGMRGSQIRQVDHAEYVTAILTERPLYVGPVPLAWLPVAKGPNLPPSFPGLPIPGLSRKPALVGRSLSQGGAVRYAISWFLPEAPATAIPRLRRQLERTGDWAIAPREAEGEARHFVSKSKGGQFQAVDLFQNPRAPEVPENFTRVDVSWADLPDL